MIERKSLVGIIVLIAAAATSDSAFGLTNFEFITVGAPGNPANPAAKLDDFSTGYGSVGYVYNLSKYETTNAQYASFLNAVAATDTYSLYNANMGVTTFPWGGITRSGVSGAYSYSVRPNYADKPVNFVSGYDAARFANWMHNGQPNGAQNAATTEDGAYTFSGFETMSARNPGAKFFLPDEHEWDKAAFYQPGVTGQFGNGWWQYVSGTNVFPTPATVDEFGNVTNPSQQTVNFRKMSNWNGATTGNVTTVGSAGMESFWGAFDMSGNVFEWTVADPTKPDPNGWGPFTVRSGSFSNEGHVTSLERNMVHHDNHNVVRQDVGFRLAGAFIEPTFDLADFNEDGFVDGDDLLAWQSGYGPEGGADADGDGASDGSDFLIWQRQVTGDAGAAAVPEPATLALVAAALGAFILGRSQSRQRA